MTAAMIEVENIHTPGRTNRVNAEKYRAMRAALMKALPAAAPGLTQAEMGSAVLPYLPEALWPGGEKAMWWVKTVQLDLEAKGLVLRTPGKPTRWRRMSNPT
mgnify:CR=1 FL=1